MSMIYGLRRVGRKELSRLIENPNEITWFLHGVEPDPPKPGLLGRLFGKKADPEGLVSHGTWEEPPEGHETDLDKAWHAIHYLLSGSPWEGDLPAGTLLVGGEGIGDIDVGYGTARALSPEVVQRYSEYLSGVSNDELRSRFDPAKLVEAEIYPDGLWEEGGGEELSYIVEYFEELKGFIRSAAESDDGVVVYLS